MGENWDGVARQTGMTGRQVKSGLEEGDREGRLQTGRRQFG
jgi:hypothetical protein